MTQPTVDTGAHPWRRAFRDVQREHGFEPLEIEGRLPEDLRGTLYRTGPALFSDQGLRYRHWFDGDGAVSAVRFTGGQAEGALRLVESAGLREERAAGRPLHDGYGTIPQRPLLARLLRALRPPRPKNTGNTSVIVWQGRLFALQEACLPTELSPSDLRTFGERDLDGVVPQTFSAHAHHVPARRAAYNFGVRYGRKTELDLFELPDEGRARRLGTLALAGPTLIHDFIATPRHLVFFAPPLRLRLLPVLLGMKSYSDSLRWEPALGTEVLVVPIDDVQRARRFTVDPFYQWHFAGAEEQGDEIVVDYVRLPDFGSNEFLSEVVRAVPSRPWVGRLHRARIQPAAGRLLDEELWDGPCEFPRALPGPARHVYVSTYSGPAAAFGLPDQVARVDLRGGPAARVGLGEAQYPSEPVPVRRPGREGQAYLLTLVYDGHADRSCVAVLDAARVEDGPLGRAWFRGPVPFTFHGNFAVS